MPCLREQREAICDRNVDTHDELPGEATVGVVVFDRGDVTNHSAGCITDTTADVTRCMTKWDLLQHVEHDSLRGDSEIRREVEVSVIEIPNIVAGVGTFQFKTASTEKT